MKHDTKEREDKKMARTNKTQGWYLFEDGTYVWFYGLSVREKTAEIRKHGKIVRFIPGK